MGLLMGFLPSLVVRDSFQAREFIAGRFLKYFQNNSHEEGSALIKARYQHSVDHNVPLDDIARFETAGAIGILTNTSPACFWLVYHLYSDPVALEDCRQEVKRILSENVSTSKDGKETKTYTLDLSQVKTSCPMMLSSLQESLRLHSVGISTRLVMEDHMLPSACSAQKHVNLGRGCAFIQSPSLPPKGTETQPNCVPWVRRRNNALSWAPFCEHGDSGIHGSTHPTL
jgi:cytochrome P450